MIGVPAAAAVVVGVLITGSVAVSVDDLPEEFLHPTPDAISESIQVWDPSDSVHEWVISNSVRALVHETTDDAETVITLTSDVLFEFGSATIPENAAAAVVKALADVPESTSIDVSGHTDSVGDPSANQTLSEQRAEAVAQVIRGARPDLVLTVAGYGENRPIESNNDPGGRQLNRRVEIRFGG